MRTSEDRVAIGSMVKPWPNNLEVMGSSHGATTLCTMSKVTRRGSLASPKIRRVFPKPLLHNWRRLWEYSNTSMADVTEDPPIVTDETTQIDDFTPTNMHGPEIIPARCALNFTSPLTPEHEAM
ncbi:hypothetical protein CsSME_00052327 [Camellia sinensis var. sinensis]